MCVSVCLRTSTCASVCIYVYLYVCVCVFECLPGTVYLRVHAPVNVIACAGFFPDDLCFYLWLCITPKPSLPFPCLWTAWFVMVWRECSLLQWEPLVCCHSDLLPTGDCVQSAASTYTWGSQLTMEQTPNTLLSFLLLLLLKMIFHSCVILPFTPSILSKSALQFLWVNGFSAQVASVEIKPLNVAVIV